MIERIKDLEYKLVTRESRPEDRERIAQVISSPSALHVLMMVFCVGRTQIMRIAVVRAIRRQCVYVYVCVLYMHLCVDAAL